MQANTIIKASGKQLITVHNFKIKLWETETSSFFDIKKPRSFIPNITHGNFKDGIIFDGKLVLLEDTW